MMTILTLDNLQWIGCATGAAGSLMLALRTRYSGWGYILFLASNGFWVMYGIETNAPGLIANQALFTATSVIGIFRWLLLPTYSSISIKKQQGQMTQEEV